MIGPGEAQSAMGASDAIASSPPGPLFWSGIGLMAAGVVINAVAVRTDRENGLTHVAVLGCAVLGLVLAFAGVGS